VKISGSVSISESLFLGGSLIGNTAELEEVQICSTVIQGRLSVSDYLLSGSSLSVTNTLEVGEGLLVDGESLLRGSLSVTSDAVVAESLSIGDSMRAFEVLVHELSSIGSALIIDSSITGLSGDVWTDKDCQVSGTLSVHIGIIGKTISASDILNSNGLSVKNDGDFGASISTAQDVHAARDIQVSGKCHFGDKSSSFSSDCVSIGPHAVFGSDLSVRGESVLNGSLSVGGVMEIQAVRAKTAQLIQLDVSGGLSVYSSSYLGNDVTIEGSTVIGELLSVLDGVFIGADISVSGLALVGASMSVGSALAVGGRGCISGALDLTGPIVSHNDISTAGNLVAGSSMSVRTDAHVGENLVVHGDALFGASVLDVAGALTGQSVSLTTSLIIGEANVSVGSALVVGSTVSISVPLIAETVFADYITNSGSLSVLEDTHLIGPVDTHTCVSVSGSLVVDGSLSVKCNSVYDEMLSVTGPLFVTDSADISGLTRFHSHVSTSGRLHFGSVAELCAGSFNFISADESTGTGYLNGVWVSEAPVTTSDLRLKREIVPVWIELIGRSGFRNATQLLQTLRPVAYSTLADESNRRFGFIAQEVERVVPDLVYTHNDTETKGLFYQDLIALLVEAVQEQQNETEQLHQKVESLMHDNDSRESELRTLSALVEAQKTMLLRMESRIQELEAKLDTKAIN
jgi:UDP-3-O-[3-hydroxymyristoyl] glucosamine N-acyltransferase